MTPSKNVIFKSVATLVKKTGISCMSCTFRDVKQCVHNEMRKAKYDFFEIPYYDFFCDFYIEEGSKDESNC